MIIGNDGGAVPHRERAGAQSTGARARPADRRATLEVRWASLNRDYGVTQFYHGLPFPDGDRYFGGAQDNGTPLGADAADRTAGGRLRRRRRLRRGQSGESADPLCRTQWATIAKSVNGGVDVH